MIKYNLIFLLCSFFSLACTQVNNSGDMPEGMVFVEGGQFQMGSNLGDSDEKPVHTVTVSSFYLGKYEVTVAEFREFVNATGYRTDAEKSGGVYVVDRISTGKIVAEKKSDASWENPYFTQMDQNPVTCVSWFDVVAYCNWRSQKESLNPCYTISGNGVTCDFQAKGYRLPTEAEWEYAARGGKMSKEYTYAGKNNAGDVGWYKDNSGDKTHPVGEKQANELGLYDMSGNVVEWCWDWYGDYSSGSSTNPRGLTDGGIHVIRGGGWLSQDINNLRTASRLKRKPSVDGRDKLSQKWSF